MQTQVHFLFHPSASWVLYWRLSQDIITARATASQASHLRDNTNTVHPFSCSSYSGPGQGHDPARKQHFCSVATSRFCLHQAQDVQRCFICRQHSHEPVSKMSSVQTAWVWRSSFKQSVLLQPYQIDMLSFLNLGKVKRCAEINWEGEMEVEWKEDWDRNM